jgi:hypothetical protein
MGAGAPRLASTIAATRYDLSAWVVWVALGCSVWVEVSWWQEFGSPICSELDGPAVGVVDDPVVMSA